MAFPQRAINTDRPPLPPEPLLPAVPAAPAAPPEPELAPPLAATAPPALASRAVPRMSVLLDPQATAPTMTASRRAAERRRGNMPPEAYTNSTFQARVRSVPVPLSRPILHDLGAYLGDTASEHLQAFGCGA